MTTIHKGDHSSLPARHLNYHQRLAHAQALRDATTNTNLQQHYQVADHHILRAIPVIGAVAGHIPGTQPENAATR